jgi:hypothetical protein
MYAFINILLFIFHLLLFYNIMEIIPNSMSFGLGACGRCVHVCEHVTWRVAEMGKQLRQWTYRIYSSWTQEGVLGKCRGKFVWER